MRTKITHIEDSILYGGAEGATSAVHTFGNLHRMLSGGASEAVDLNVKWDGAPMIVAGTDPADGMFFVGTKSYFNKTPVMYKSSAQIDQQLSGDLARKLKIALAELPKLGFDGILAGDMLYTKQDLQQRRMGNTSYLVFRPNTIAYSVPIESDLADRIRRSKMGVAWHTAVSGKLDVERMNDTASVWVTDAEYRDVSGTATFTEAEMRISMDLQDELHWTLSEIPEYYMDMFTERELSKRLSEFVRKFSTNGDFAGAPKQVADKFAEYLTDHYNSEIANRSTPRAKEAAAMSFARGAAPVVNNQLFFQYMIEAYMIAVELKKLFLKKLNIASSIDTFVETDIGFRVTGPEGFVVTDRQSGDVVKLVDKMQFTRANSSQSVFKGFKR